MPKNISNSIVNINSTVNGDVTNVVHQMDDHQILNAIKGIEDILQNESNDFSPREIRLLVNARNELEKGDIESAGRRLTYFKEFINEVTKLTTSSVFASALVALIKSL